MLKVIILALVVTVVAIIAITVVDNMTVDASSAPTSNTITGDSNLIAVSLDGEVRYAGTYYVEVNSTLGEAMDMAGGPTSNADPLAYNTGYICENGMSFYIAPLYDNSNTCSTSPISKVNVNVADKSELLNVPGFGDAVSSALIDYRNNTATFGRIEDIKNVSGIGEATFRKARDFITIRSAA